MIKLFYIQKTYTHVRTLLLLSVLIVTSFNAIGQRDATNVSKEELKAKNKYFEYTVVAFVQEDGQKIYKPYALMSEEERERIPPLPPSQNEEARGEVLEPLPKGSVIELFNDGRVVINLDGDIPPPPPPMPKK